MNWLFSPVLSRDLEHESGGGDSAKFIAQTSRFSAPGSSTLLLWQGKRRASAPPKPRKPSCERPKVEDFSQNTCSSFSCHVFSLHSFHEHAFCTHPPHPAKCLSAFQNNTQPGPNHQRSNPGEATPWPSTILANPAIPVHKFFKQRHQ